MSDIPGEVLVVGLTVPTFVLQGTDTDLVRVRTSVVAAIGGVGGTLRLLERVEVFGFDAIPAATEGVGEVVGG